MLYFKDIHFGKATAELESNYYPELLINGFLDPWDIIDSLCNTPKFLCLGYKGSGKSAIGEHIKLAAEAKNTLFVNHTYLSDFPYNNFSKIVTGDAEPESRFPSAWSWILLLNLISSFDKDIGSLSNLDTKFAKSIQALKSIGLLPVDDIKKTVIASSKPVFKAKLPEILEIELDSKLKMGTDLQFLYIVDALKRFTCIFKSTNRHMLIIDGLDDILLQKEIQYQSIAALILEVTRLNLFFSKNSVPAKIIVLCRTELYERLPGPNKNKIRQDLSVELDWYHNPYKPFSSKLVYLVNKRAQLHDETIKDIFSTLLPKEIGSHSLLSYLLFHTRHTPRDFIQTLVHVQNCCGRRDVEVNQVIAGLSQYSLKYFLPEILDELVGYTSRSNTENILRAFSTIKKRIFSVKEFSKHISTNNIILEEDIISTFNSLYQCSAIGNFIQTNGKDYYSFKYRNRHSTFREDENIIIHRGLWKAMNIV